MTSLRVEPYNHSKEPLKEWPMTYMWTTHDIGLLIRDIGFPQYSKCFTDNMINGRDIRFLTVFDLQRMGVNDMLDAMRLHASLKTISTKRHHNFDNPDIPPNTCYKPTTVTTGPEDAWMPPAAQAGCTKMTAEEYRLPYRDQGSTNNRYRLSMPTVHYQRSICDVKNNIVP